jgi:hypothetical protein
MSNDPKQTFLVFVSLVSFPLKKIGGTQTFFLLFEWYAVENRLGTPDIEDRGLSFSGHRTL